MAALAQRTRPPTEVMVRRAVFAPTNLAVFELVMWQSWTGR